MNTRGCTARWRYNHVVPQRGAPTMKTSGLIAPSGDMQTPTRARALQVPVGECPPAPEMMRGRAVLQECGQGLPLLILVSREESPAGQCVRAAIRDNRTNQAAASP